MRTDMRQRDQRVFLAVAVLSALTLLALSFGRLSVGRPTISLGGLLIALGVAAIVWTAARGR